MDNKKAHIVDVNHLVEDFFEKEKNTINNIRHELSMKIFKPFTDYLDVDIAKSKGNELLIDCAQIALQELETVCKKKSIDFWMPIIRRIPLGSIFSTINGISYATLAVMKWSDYESDSAVSRTHHRDTYFIGLHVSTEDMLDCLRIAILSDIIDRIITNNRFLGKGAKMKVGYSCMPELQVSDEVIKATSFYDSREPSISIFHDEGIFTEIKPTIDNNFFVMPARLKQPKRIVFSKNNITIPFNANCFFTLINSQPIISALNTYEDPIRDKFGLGTGEIVQVLHGLSINILNTVSPFLENLNIVNDEFVCELDIDQEKNRDIVSFLLGFCQKGYFRFPEDMLRERLANYYSTFVHSEGDAINLVNRFFKQFSLTKERRGEIDVLALNPFPLICTSPGGDCFLNYQNIFDFLAWIFRQAKDWYGTLHGDRFTLALKKLIENRVNGIQILLGRQLFTTQDGKRAEADLVLKKDDIIYIIECKAYSKSREFWLGNYKAVNDRTGKINEAVKQVIRTLNVAKECYEDKTVCFGKVDGMEWVVCTPSKEFIKPIDKHGMLTKDIPKVCTPEELVTYLG